MVNTLATRHYAICSLGDGQFTSRTKCIMVTLHQGRVGGGEIVSCGTWHD
jgi:hypothetical protein